MWWSWMSGPRWPSWRAGTSRARWWRRGMTSAIRTRRSRACWTPTSAAWRRNWARWASATIAWWWSTPTPSITGVTKGGCTGRSNTWGIRTSASWMGGGSSGPPMRRFESGPAKPRPAVFKANVDPSLITNKAEVRRLVEEPNPDTILADARSTEEYNGAFQQGIARGGHIPSAVNVPWNQFFNPDGTVKPVEAIRAVLEKHGVASGKEVVCYCTGGVRSAWLYFILKLAGYEKVKNYPGSWWEWGNDYTLPVVNLKEQQRPPIQRTMPNKPPTVH